MPSENAPPKQASDAIPMGSPVRPGMAVSAMALSGEVQMTFIMPAMGRDDDVVKMFGKYHITPDIAYSTNESFSAWAMVENGLGISITNELLMHGWSCDVAKVPVDPPESITLGVILPSLQHASPAVKRFVTYAESVLKR